MSFGIGPVRSGSSVVDLTDRAQLNRSDLQALAAANALESLAGNRRQARWQAVASAPDKGLLRPAAVKEATQEIADIVVTGRVRQVAIPQYLAAFGSDAAQHCLAN